MFLSSPTPHQVVSFRVFDKLYLRYDEWYKRNYVIFECELNALRMLKLGGRGLDLGVGTGIFASRIGVEFGVDPALNPLKLAKDRGVEVVQAMGEYLPFRDKCFDYILIALSLCFFDNPIDILREARRCLKDSGKIAVCVILKDSSWGRYYEMLKERGHDFYRHANFYTLDEIREMLSSINLSIEKVYATLSYTPDDEPMIEEPSEEIDGRSFVCLSAIPESRPEG